MVAQNELNSATNTLKLKQGELALLSQKLLDTTSAHQKLVEDLNITKARIKDLTGIRIKVVQELKQKGFASDLIATQAELLKENEANRMQTVWQKKFGAAPQNPAEKAKQMRFLASRGFATSTIAQWMRHLPVMDDEGLEE